MQDFLVRMAAHLIDMVIVGGILLFARIPLALLSLLLPTELLEYRVLFSYTIKDIYLYLGGVLYYILLTYYTWYNTWEKADESPCSRGNRRETYTF